MKVLLFLDCQQFLFLVLEKMDCRLLDCQIIVLKYSLSVFLFGTLFLSSCERLPTIHILQFLKSDSPKVCINVAIVVYLGFVIVTISQKATNLILVLDLFGFLKLYIV